MAERVAAGTMTEAERRDKPKKPGHLGAKKTDSGELPLEHLEIVKHTDPIHDVKNYKSELYIQVALPKSKSERCKADAMRLSRNMSYMLRQLSAPPLLLVIALEWLSIDLRPPINDQWNKATYDH
jgi:hypothetical protein